MGGKWSAVSAIGVLGTAAIAASLNCGSTGQEGFAPAADAGAEGYPSFGSSPPADWSVPFGGSAVTPYAVSAAADGTVRIAGTLGGLVTLGAVTLETAGGSDVLVAKLAAGGEVLWAHSYGDVQNQSASASAVDAAGNVIVVGTFAGTLDLSANRPVIQSVSISQTTGGPGTAPLHALGASDAFVAKFDPNGAQVWSIQFGGAGATTHATSVAIGPHGQLAITGEYEGTVGFGNGAATSVGGTDVFVVELDAAGNPQWAKSFGQTGTDRGTSIAVNGQGELLVTGNYEGGLNLGTGALPAFGMEDVFVAKIGAGGATEWSKGFGGPLDDDAVAVAYDPSGNEVTLGNYAGDVDLGTGPLPSYSPPGGGCCGSSPGQLGWDIYVAEYNATAKGMWAHHYGSVDPIDKGDSLVVDSDGNTYVAGHIRSTFTFGNCPVVPANAEFGDAFVGKIGPAGDAICAREYGYGPTAHVRSMALHPAQGLVMVGDFIGGIDFGQGPFVSDTDTGFSAREEPFPEPLQ